MFVDELMKMLEERKDEMIAIRRHLHENAEPSFQEVETAKYIAAFYEGKDVKIDKEIGGKHGIVVTIKGGKPGKTIGLRADFDALPLKEETGLPFASKNEGAMHACGHDGHTAYLMVLADCLIKLKDQLSGTVKIIHQNAEEMAPGGAKDIVASGVLNDLDYVFGIHFLPNGPAGTVGWHKGYTFTGRSYMKLKIKGMGGHGSSPHLANDAIVAGAYFVTEAQTVISRRLNPFDVGVITIGFSTFDYMQSGVFEDFYIRPEYRHKGIASRLVQYAYGESGISSLTVGCADCDINMYQSLGFSISLGNLLAFEP